MINICLNASIPEDCMIIAYEITKEMEEMNYENSIPLKVDDYIFNCQLISNRKYHEISKVNGFDPILYGDMYYFKAVIKFPKTTVRGLEDMSSLGDQLDRMEALLSCGHNYVRYEESDIRKMMDDFDLYKQLHDLKALSTRKNINDEKGDKTDEK